MAAELNFKQELVGCFGYPVAENPTQAMIEPAMTIVLGAILGWVMLAVLGPVYDTISKMKF